MTGLRSISCLKVSNIIVDKSLLPPPPLRHLPRPPTGDLTGSVFSLYLALEAPLLLSAVTGVAWIVVIINSAQHVLRNTEQNTLRDVGFSLPRPFSLLRSWEDFFLVILLS